MRSQGHRFFTLAVGLATLALGGCKKQAPAPPSDTGAASPTASSAEFSVRGVDVGKQIGSDKRISNPTTSFAPRDTIYVSVATEGSAPSKTIGVKWSYQDGQTIKEAKETIAPTGPAATEFHLAKASGWPAGKYKVEVTVDGSPAGTKEFEVKK
ncbi:MAG TPA: hypothetical protein VFH40_10635 [Gemmatimonadales bacterium]|nr:hypothetical protein [Gemmatimonadales bacterium]